MKNTETKERRAMERQWQAEDDARIMAQYQEIVGNKARLARATKEATKQAKELERRAQSLKSIATKRGK